MKTNNVTDSSASSSAVSVVIACHTLDRLPQLEAAIGSVQRQEVIPHQIIVTVDHAPNLAALLRANCPEITIVENKFERGAAGNRNSGADVVETPLIAFLDDDARARPGWLEALLEPFDEPNVVCAGGFVAPAWSGVEPRWFPAEFAWVVGASHRGLPTRRTEVRNVWSENMAVRTSTFADVGGFRQTFGKVGSVSRPEDTDLCIRMGKAFPGATVMFVPSAVVDHHVGQERSSLRFFMRRSYYEGRGKIELAYLNDGGTDLGDEGHYLSQTIPRGLATYLRNGVAEPDLGDLYRAMALLGGCGAAAAGAAVSTIALGFRNRPAMAGGRRREKVQAS